MDLLRKVLCVLCVFAITVGSASVVTARTWSDSLARSVTVSEHTMPYRLFLPKNYDPAIKYPVVLYMHGSGERGNNNTNQVRSHIGGLINRTEEDYPSILVAPQVPRDAYYWWPEEDYDLTPEILTEVADTFSTDPNRLYLTGLSMGGFGNYHFLQSDHGWQVAAMVPMSGARFGDPTVPQWLFHGELDTAVPVSYARDTFRSSAGLEPTDPIVFNTTAYGYPTAVSGHVRYTELSSRGHNIWNTLYNNSNTDLYDWMFAQAIPEPSSLGLVAIAGLFIISSRPQRF